MHNFPLPFPAFLALSAAAVILLCALSGLAQVKPVIRVRAEATLEKTSVTLGDIAEISAAAGQRLTSISLGYAPAVGMTREIARGQIVMALAAGGFPEGEIVLDAPATVIIRRAGQTVSIVQIRETVEKAVLSGLAPDRIEAKIEARILRLEAPENIQAPVGKLDIRANLSNIRNPFSRFSLPVEIRLDDRLVRTFAANVEIEAFADVLVAAKDLSINTKIAGADVKFEKRKLTKPVAAYVLDTAKLRGAMLIKNLAAGSEITTDAFVSGVVVKYGDTVSLEAVSGNLKLIIVTEARGTGKIGDRIAVKNLQSGAILQAVVTDEGHARVAF